jgi:murein DD-endopeptidase MepM/ murein hydrolase activator NlpD
LTLVKTLSPGVRLRAVLARFTIVLGVALAFGSLAPQGWAADTGPAIEISGEPVQSGLLIGRGPAGVEVHVNDTRVRQSPEGLFLIGLDRDAPADLVIEVRPPSGGAKLTYRLAVKSRDYDVQRIDGLPERSVTPKPEDVARITADSNALREARQRDSVHLALLAGFVWPLEGRISGVFGSQRILNGKPRQPHRGIDIAAPSGTPVRAMAGGTVSLAAPDMFFTGRTVVIDHGHGLSSIYAHLHEIDVKPGETVEAGRIIGQVGQTGRASGAHLHWGVSLFDAFLDPALLARHPALATAGAPAN